MHADTGVASLKESRTLGIILHCTMRRYLKFNLHLILVIYSLITTYAGIIIIIVLIVSIHIARLLTAVDAK